LRYDLHLHSTASDGSLSPEELMSLCAEKKLQCVALTDHDTLSGLPLARKKAEELGLNLISGIELSCVWRRQTLHLLSIGLDEHNPEVKAFMVELETIRQQRAEKIAERLVKKGINASILDNAQTIAGNVSLCRPHFAKALVEMGHVRSVKDAFDVYLGQGKAGDVKALWPDLEKVIALVKQANGYTILAHPTKYNMTFTRLRLLFEELKGLGVDAIEVSYPGLNPDQGRELLRWVKHYGFKVSAGSDFHSTLSPWTLPGCFPEIELNENHILNVLLSNMNVDARMS